jgi:predicted DNA-binding transcriptional regulator AlpA
MSKLLTPTEVSQRLGVEEKTLRKWRTKPGRGPVYVKLGPGRFDPVRYPEHELERWIKSHTHGSSFEYGRHNG